MIRTGQQYLDSIRDNREVHINGERVKDVTQHPMMKPLIDIRARIYDMQHEAATRDILSYQKDGARNAVANKLPRTQQDWWDKRRATDTILADYRRSRDARRRRDGRRDVVAVRRPGRAQRG
jgi:4-hydroxyphenylacetate 3-monooxygenase